ncbi:TMEM175 family protein [Nocardia sp. NBC_01499]|uniref:TMEM175 family protein n=1 Tax=Nocardia sp. NBC_01499 TaxID=2903597 RepID=UPI00386A8177
MTDRVPPSPRDEDFSAHRMGAFADAVLAIAITLLVIEIKRPEGEDLASPHALAEFLWHEKASFVAFVLAFFLLWSVWRRHHTLIDEVDRLDRATAASHAPLLLLAAFLPFPTAIFGHAPDNKLAACLFAATAAALFGCEAVMKEFAWRRAILKPGVDRSKIRMSAGASVSVTVVFAVTAGLVWVTPWIWFIWFFAPLAAYFGGKLSERIRPDVIDRAPERQAEQMAQTRT